jgi:hypothetical protein
VALAETAVNREMGKPLFSPRECVKHALHGPRPTTVVSFFSEKARATTLTFGMAILEGKWSCVLLGDHALFGKLRECGIPEDCLDSPRRVGYPA